MKYRKFFLGFLIPICLMGSSDRTQAEQIALRENLPNVDYSLQEKYNDLKYQLKCAQEEINRIQEENYYIKDEKTTIKTNLEKLVSDRDNLSKKLFDTQIILKSLQEQKSTLENSVNSGESEKSVLQNRLLKAESDLNMLKTQVSALQNTLENKNTQIAEFFAKEQAKNSEIAMLKNKTTVSEEQNTKNLSQLQNLNQLNSVFEDTDFEIGVKAVKSMKEDPKTKALYYFNLAKTYQQSQAMDKAIANYKLAIAANPKLDAAYSQLGILYAEKGDYKNSIDIFNKYLDMNLAKTPEEKQLIKNFIGKMKSLEKK